MAGHMLTSSLSTLLLLPFAVASSLVFLPALVPAFSSRKLKSLETIASINKNGPYIGIITVFSLEEDAFFADGSFKPDSQHPFLDLSGRRFRFGKILDKRVIYVKCGVGMVNAAAATQQMLDFFDLLGVIHFGISGNTNNSLSIGDVLIPQQFVNTGLWDWLKPNATVPSNDAAELEIQKYNVPSGGSNSLGIIGYTPEQFYSEAGEAVAPQQVLWFNASNTWLRLASRLEISRQGLRLEKCVNSSLCLEKQPRVVFGLKASTANFFLDNAAYRDFLFHTFGVSSADMESSAVVMTSSSNGTPVIVIRGLSDLAGAQQGPNSMHLFGSLAASNVVRVVVHFIELLSQNLFDHHKL